MPLPCHRPHAREILKLAPPRAQVNILLHRIAFEIRTLLPAPRGRHATGRSTHRASFRYT
eukprot:6198124-Pleurochrysis_carterae.AAC.3